MKPTHYPMFLLAVAGAICFAPPAADAETKTATVSPGATEVVEFDGNPSGIYELSIQAAAGHTINDSDFTAEFKSTTLWQRNSKTSYDITYVDNPKPPGVSIKGDFASSGGGGEGYSPNFFLVNVPNVDCEPEDKELFVIMKQSSFFENSRMHLATVRPTARWNQPENFDCTIGICQNVKFNLKKIYSDGSSIGVSSSSYLIDGDYPNQASSSGTAGDGKRYTYMEDQPATSVKTGEAPDLNEMHYSIEAENFFMIIPQQGPAISKMIVSWSASSTVKRDANGLSLHTANSNPDGNNENTGSESERPPVSVGENAAQYGNSRWKKLSGGATSMAEIYLPLHNMR